MIFYLPIDGGVFVDDRTWRQGDNVGFCMASAIFIRATYIKGFFDKIKIGRNDGRFVLEPFMFVCLVFFSDRKCTFSDEYLFIYTYACALGVVKERRNGEIILNEQTRVLVESVVRVCRGAILKGRLFRAIFKRNEEKTQVHTRDTQPKCNEKSNLCNLKKVAVAAEVSSGDEYILTSVCA